jgi:hypothetical protein
MSNDNTRARLIRAFERRLVKCGWAPGANWSWHKGQHCIECDDVGFWLWEDARRIKGKAWDSMTTNFKWTGHVWFHDRSTFTF